MSRYCFEQIEDYFLVKNDFSFIVKKEKFIYKFIKFFLFVQFYVEISWINYCMYNGFV